jgi:WD40 repeat protein
LNERFSTPKYPLSGYSSGNVLKFNIQSGMSRGEYGDPAHKTAVRGVEVDNLNQFVITGSSDGKIKFWNFKQKGLCLRFSEFTRKSRSQSSKIT